LFPTPGVDCASPSAPFTATTTNGASSVTTGGGTIGGGAPAAISLSPLSVTAGNSTTVTGTIFTTNGTVTLTLTNSTGTVTLGTATVSAGGFSTTVTIPSNTSPGGYTIHAAAPNAQADATLQVAAPGGHASLTVSSDGQEVTSITTDTDYTLTGNNFAPEFAVNIHLDSKTGPILGTVTTPLSETFTMDLDVTAAQIGNSNGNHTLVAESNGFAIAERTYPFVVNTDLVR